MGRPPRYVDWSLYVVTDSGVIGDRSLLDVVEAALRGGATVVQYREKKKTTRVMVEEAAALAALCRRYRAAFLVNDRIDVALAVEAHGVHLGQDDMPLEMARRLLGPNRLIGITVHNRREIEEAQRGRADYLSVAPVFATPTKPDHQTPMGVDGLRRLMADVRSPAVAIGGINTDNIADVVRTGVAGVCVVSAVLGREDPEEAARTLRRLMDEARRPCHSPETPR